MITESNDAVAKGEGVHVGHLGADLSSPRPVLAACRPSRSRAAAIRRSLVSMQVSERQKGASTLAAAPSPDPTSSTSPSCKQRRDPGGERLPGAAGRVVTVELVDQALRHLVPALGLQLPEALLVPLERRIARAGRLVQAGPHRRRAAVRRQRIERLRPLATVDHEPRLAQPPEVGGDPRLGHPRDAHQVGHAELAIAQQRAEADAVLVARAGSGCRRSWRGSWMNRAGSAILISG